MPEDISELTNEIKNDLHFKQEERLTIPEIIKFEALIQLDYGASFELSSVLRKKFLTVLNDYYRLHIDNFGTLNSIKILNEVFH